MAPPPKYEVKRIPSVPHPGPPPIPEQEIVRRLAAAEDAAQKVYSTYDFLQTIRIEELSTPGGKFTVTGQEYTRPDGQRMWRMVKPAESTLKLTHYSFEDVRTITTLPIFFLTSDQIANYDFLYAGQQKLDELNTYVFQVKPKQLSRSQRLFQGVVFVDDHDLEAIPRGAVGQGILQLSYVVDAGVAGAVDLAHIDVRALRDLETSRAFETRRDRRPQIFAGGRGLRIAQAI